MLKYPSYRWRWRTFNEKGVIQSCPRRKPDDWRHPPFNSSQVSRTFSIRFHSSEYLDMKLLAGAETVSFLCGQHPFIIDKSKTSLQTWSSIEIFLLAILLNPHVQKKAQSEIDRVLGNRRLPEFNDRDALPYVECIMQESMRLVPYLKKNSFPCD